jgi:hypothetical protein
MSVVYLLAAIAIFLIVFFAGYNLALRSERIFYQQLGDESTSLEPIFARLDREWKYTDELTKPFTDDKQM